MQEYVSDLRRELLQLRSLRIISIASALALVVVILLVLIFFVVRIQAAFLAEEGYFKAVVVTVCILSCTLLVSIFMKGAFRTVAERNADDPVTCSFEGNNWRCANNSWKIEVDERESRRGALRQVSGRDLTS